MTKEESILIFEPAEKKDYDHVRALINQFVSWHRIRNVEDLALLDEYFDGKAFETELKSLPGKYSKPEGGLLLALVDGQPAGCVALRKIDDQTCEMKRMFVDTKFQGKGIGRALCKKIIDEARRIGYQTMKLDTSFRQVEAQKLYQSVGFTSTTPYYDMPKKVEEWLVFMEMKL